MYIQSLESITPSPTLRGRLLLYLYTIEYDNDYLLTQLLLLLFSSLVSLLPL